VNFFGAKDGLVHISQISQEKVGKTSDVLTEGQMVKVKLVGFDDRGKTKLSMKVVDQETGEDLTEKLAAERAARGEPEEEERSERPRRDRGDRDRGDRPRRRDRD
jgi:polyribonucleotide nucleotidyltransferase